MMTREDEKVNILTEGCYNSLEEIKTVLDVAYRQVVKNYNDKFKGMNVEPPITNVTLTEDNKFKFDLSVSVTTDFESLKGGSLVNIL